MRICPRCGEENSERARFCQACAAPLAEEAAPREVRKTVTVVFADVTGSTGLGDRLDPESLRRVMNRYFDEMRAAVERHGGTVEKFIGDAVMAVFGIPVLHEDDALRAVRAADEMRLALKTLNKELERDRGVTIAMRIGVNTGQVVAGDATAGQRLVTGDAVNVAARLEQAAAPGEILMGEDTFHLVRDAVAAEAGGSLELKGKPAPVPAYRVLDVSGTAPGHARRLDSPMVGRQRQLELLRRAFESATADRSCHLFTILGPAGVGKSRLVAEFLGEAVEGVRVVRGRCLSYGEGITFFPVREVIDQAIGPSEMDGPGEVRVKLTAILAGEHDAAAIVERVAQVVDAAGGTASAEETSWAVRRFLEALARERPLIVMFDDVHWAEPTFLDLVEHVADWARDAPILLVCLARGELLDLRPAWGGGKLNATTISLEPLSDGESELLIENLLGSADLAADVRRRIAAAAEGNPLFVEEMLSMLIDDGLLRREEGRWAPGGDLRQVTVPPTIQALLAARLERLSPHERTVLEAASVEGKVFHRGAVVALSPPGANDLGRHLLALVRKELVRADRPELTGEDAFRFRHQLVRDAAYQAIPKEVRADLHERFAGWLSGVVGERAPEYDEFLGYHLEQAHRYRGELGPMDERGSEVARRAAGHLARAGRRASDRVDLHAAANLLRRAVALLPPQDPPRLEILPDLAQTLVDTGRMDEAATVIEEATEAALASGDRLLEARAGLPSLEIRQYREKTPSGEVLSEAEGLMAELEALGDSRAAIRAGLLVSASHFYLGSCRRSEELLLPLRARAREIGDSRAEVQSTGQLGACLYYGPTPVPEAIARVEELLTMAGEHPLMESVCLDTLIALLAMDGRFEEARRFIRRTREIKGELGLWHLTALLGFLLAPALLLEGDVDGAESAIRESIEALERVGERGFLSTLLCDLAHIQCGGGRLEEAEKLAVAGREAAATDDFASQGEWRSAMARVLARRGDHDRAVALAREAVEIWEGSDYLDLRGQALGHQAEVLLAATRREEAAEALANALERFEAKGNRVSAGRARDALAELRST